MKSSTSHRPYEHMTDIALEEALENRISSLATAADYMVPHIENRISVLRAEQNLRNGVSSITQQQGGIPPLDRPAD